MPRPSRQVSYVPRRVSVYTPHQFEFDGYSVSMSAYARAIAEAACVRILPADLPYKLYQVILSSCQPVFLSAVQRYQRTGVMMNFPSVEGSLKRPLSCGTNAPLSTPPKRGTLVSGVIVQETSIGAHGPECTTVAVTVTSPPVLDRSAMHAQQLQAADPFVSRIRCSSDEPRKSTSMPAAQSRRELEHLYF